MKVQENVGLYRDLGACVSTVRGRNCGIPSIGTDSANSANHVLWGCIETDYSGWNC